MPDPRYSNREIREMFNDITTTLTRVETQTTKTNGRVGKIEQWQSFMQGGLAILALMVVPVLLYVITRVFIK